MQTLLRNSAFPGRCFVIILLFSKYSKHSRLTFTIRQASNWIALARKDSRLQNHKAVRSIVARTMSDGGGFRHEGYYNRPRGRGRLESHGNERSVRARPNREEYRDWINAHIKPPRHHERFVLVSYNILADVNAWQHRKELYWHIPEHMWPSILHWDARKRKILLELRLWSPDIICLQEVDHYEDLREALQKEGYAGVYTRRTGGTHDGCAMFWRENRFELLEEESVKFIHHNLRDNVAQLCVLQAKSKNIEHCDSEDSGEPTTSGSHDQKKNRVVVGNIHVLFNPKRGDVKLGQTRLLLEKAHALSEKYGSAPVAVAGDFNSTPESALYQFISSSQLDLAGHDRRYISGQERGSSEGFRTNGYSNGGSKYDRYSTASGSSRGFDTWADEELVSESIIKTVDLEESTVTRTGEMHSVTTETSLKMTSTETLKSISKPMRVRRWDQFELMTATGRRNLSVVQHKMTLRSAYSEIQGKSGSRDERGEPWVTTCHKKFSGTVDYIWHTDNLVTLKVLDTIPTSDLPSKKWGSDHLALACEFSFVPSKETVCRNFEPGSE